MNAEIAQTTQMLVATRKQAVATLAAVLIGRSSGPVSHTRVMEILRDAEHILFPDRNSGAYQQWAKTADDKEYG